MREEATVRSTTVDALKYVTGYIIPTYIDRLPDGRRVAGIGERDLGRVSDGYACGECLATFERRFPQCPGCGHDLDVNRDVVDWAPDYWQPYEGRTSDEILAS